MATFQRYASGGQVAAGTVSGFASPVPTSPPSSRLDLWDNDSSANWAVVIFVFAALFLYVFL
jgi:hypothetical protein